MDILPEIDVDDGVAYISFYLEEDEDKEKMLQAVREELKEIGTYVNVGSMEIEESQTEDVDWVNNWKQYFHQFTIDDVLIIPSWEDVQPEDEDKMIIHIDPGTAFGTGMHETTQLCIRQIKKYVTEDTEILDVGCGSGILGMLALKFGAKHSTGTDLDPCAIDATHENMEVNGISRDQYRVMMLVILSMTKRYRIRLDMTVMISWLLISLQMYLVPLTPVILHQLKTGGICILPPVLSKTRRRAVVAAVKAAGLEVLEVTPSGRVGISDRQKELIIQAESRRKSWAQFFVTADQV